MNIFVTIAINVGVWLAKKVIDNWLSKRVIDGGKAVVDACKGVGCRIKNFRERRLERKAGSRER